MHCISTTRKNIHFLQNNVAYNEADKIILQFLDTILQYARKKGFSQYQVNNCIESNINTTYCGYLDVVYRCTYNDLYLI